MVIWLYFKWNGIREQDEASTYNEVAVLKNHINNHRMFIYLFKKRNGGNMTKVPLYIQLILMILFRQYESGK